MDTKNILINNYIKKAVDNNIRLNNLEEKIGNVVINDNMVSVQLKQNTDILNNIKAINVLNHNVKGDGVTDNTEIVKRLISKGYRNLYFPKGEYVTSIITVSKMTILGDGKNETFLIQPQKTNKNVIDVIDNTHFIDIKNMTIKGSKDNTQGNGIFINGSSTDNYCNYIFIENVDIAETIEDGFHCEGFSVENKLTNVTITGSGKRNIYNEGHDLIMTNVKIQRAGEENIINKGANTLATNMQIIYGNSLQKNKNKSDDDIKYSVVINGDRGSYNNIDCQDCFGHAVKIKDANDINLSNFLVDAVGIDKDETEWWMPNTPNDCIGFNIENSEVRANSVHVTNWHNNEQGSSYVIDGNSKLYGTITRNIKNNIVKKEEIYTENIYNGSLEEKLFNGMKEILSKTSVNWGYNLFHSGTPSYSMGRYGMGVDFNSISENMVLDISDMNINSDFELSFTYTPKVEWDNTNTRWLLYSDFNNNILEVLLSVNGEPAVRFYDNNKYYSINISESLEMNVPYRFFVKIIGNKLLVRVYKYNQSMGEYIQTLDISPSNGTTKLYFGNNKTPQSWWSCNGIIEDIHISRTIPELYDFKEIDNRIKITPLTLFKANIDGSIK